MLVHTSSISLLGQEGAGGCSTWNPRAVAWVSPPELIPGDRRQPESAEHGHWWVSHIMAGGSQGRTGGYPAPHCRALSPTCTPFQDSDGSRQMRRPDPHGRPCPQMVPCTVTNTGEAPWLFSGWWEFYGETEVFYMLRLFSLLDSLKICLYLLEKNVILLHIYPPALPKWYLKISYFKFVIHNVYHCEHIQILHFADWETKVI